MSDWIYERTKDNKYRYLLGETGKNMLMCIGVNPSTATPEKLDPTLRRVKEFSKRLGYDGWLMANLYPLRATNPNDLPEEEYIIPLHNINIFWIRKSLEDHPIKNIWAAWGTVIEKRDYLKTCKDDIIAITVKNGARWIHIGPLTKNGHPRHPLYLPYSAEVHEYQLGQCDENGYDT